VTSSGLSQLRRLSWAYPEWWSLCLSAAAWLGIFCSVPSLFSGVHSPEHMHILAGSKQSALSAFLKEISSWLLMVVAMMFPMTISAVRTTAARSLWCRRHRAIGIFLIGYISAWMVFGVAILAGIGKIESQLLSHSEWIALSFSVALLWQMTPIKRRAVMFCHQTRPLAPVGWPANRDCLRYGWATGSWCVISCWGLMVPCMLSGHSILPMMCGIAVGWKERNRFRVNQLVICTVIASFAIGYALLTLI
jgi:predicted metal-binding membrane protein